MKWGIGSGCAWLKGGLWTILWRLSTFVFWAVILLYAAAIKLLEWLGR